MPTLWSGGIANRKAICSSGFLSPPLCYQASKNLWPGDSSVWTRRQFRGSVTSWQLCCYKYSAAARTCNCCCPSCHCHHPPQRITLSIHHKAPSCCHSFNNCFFFKRHFCWCWSPEKKKKKKKNLSSPALAAGTAIRAARTESTTGGAFERDIGRPLDKSRD